MKKNPMTTLLAELRAQGQVSTLTVTTRKSTAAEQAARDALRQSSRTHIGRLAQPTWRQQ